MEFIQAPLSGVISESGGLSSQRAISILLELSDCIDQLHRNGLIHTRLDTDRTHLDDAGAFLRREQGGKVVRQQHVSRPGRRAEHHLDRSPEDNAGVTPLEWAKRRNVPTYDEIANVLTRLGIER